MTLKLELPSGDLEEVRVGASKYAVAVLMKVMSLRRKHKCLRLLSEEVELVKADGSCLCIKEPIEAQVKDGDVLVIRDQATASGESSEQGSSETESADDALPDETQDPLERGDDLMALYGACFGAEDDGDLEGEEE